MVLMQPLATAVVRRLAPLGIDPLGLVTLHSAMAFVAAGLIAGVAPGEGTGSTPGWIVAAGLLAGKALLDNVDGGLARATGRVTKMGRYYDTGMDLLVNAALFAALARHAGVSVALAGFLASTLVLSIDFNMERLYREARGRQPAPSGSASDDDVPRGAPAPLYALFRGLYRWLLAPQDLAIERADRALFARLEKRPYDAAPQERRRAWSDLFSTAALVDLGLTTQTVALALLLLLGRPGAFPWLCLAGLAWALGVQVRRAMRYRAYRRGMEASPS